MANILEEIEIIEGQDSRILQITDKSAQTKIGSLNELVTTSKDTLVNAINETYDYTKHIDDDKVIPLQTSVQTISNNLDNEITNRQSADGQLNQRITDLYNQVNPNYKRILTVGSHGCDFTTINSAITSAKQYSSSNQRTAILITSGVYSEEIQLENNGIDLIGLGMVKVVAISTYPHAPLEVYGSVNVSNIYFQNTNDGSSSSYAMHYEGSNDITVKDFECNFINCIFVSSANSSVGMGMSAGMSARFFNCLFYTTNPNVAPVYLHNLLYGSTNLQSAEFYNCTFNGTNSNAMLVDNSRAMNDGQTLSPMMITLVNCISGVNHIGIIYRATNSIFLPYIPESGEISLSVRSTNNDILGANYGERAYTITRNIVCPYYANTADNAIDVDFFTPFNATQYYRRLDSVMCNGVNVTSDFSVNTAGINTNKVQLSSTNNEVLGRVITVTMNFSLDEQFR